MSAVVSAVELLVDSLDELLVHVEEDALAARRVPLLESEAALGEQLFHDTIERLKGAPEQELELIKKDLKDLAALIKAQEHRDQAFHTLLVIATADHEIKASEHRLMTELKELIGSTVMVPMPSISV